MADRRRKETVKRGHSSFSLPQRYSDDSTQVDTYSGQRDVVNRATSPFGKCQTLRFLDRLYQNSGGVLLVRGDGSTVFFASGSTAGQYAPEAGHPELDSLIGDWTNGFTLLWMDGSKQKFNASGILTSSLDSLWNTTTYSYIDADSDGQTDDLRVQPAGAARHHDPARPRRRRRADRAGHRI